MGPDRNQHRLPGGLHPPVESLPDRVATDHGQHDVAEDELLGRVAVGVPPPQHLAVPVVPRDAEAPADEGTVGQAPGGEAAARADRPRPQPLRRGERALPGPARVGGADRARQAPVPALPRPGAAFLRREPEPCAGGDAQHHPRPGAPEDLARRRSRSREQGIHREGGRRGLTPTRRDHAHGRRPIRCGDGQPLRRLDGGGFHPGSHAALHRGVTGGGSSVHARAHRPCRDAGPHAPSLLG